jgi:hypothetical protein
MIEHDSGKGRLVSLAADQREYMVEFVLNVKLEVTRESARLSPPRKVPRYSLSVNEKGQAIPEGDYTLKMSNETKRVRKTGRMWIVVTN